MKYGEYLINAQGEDVVAGIRTPEPLSKVIKNGADAKNDNSMETVMPDLYRELTVVFKKLESHYLDMQDVEFTYRKISFGYCKQEMEKEQPTPQ